MTNLSNSLADLAERIRLANEAVEVSQRTTAEKAMEAGALLIEAKAVCKHGDWLAFLVRTGVKKRTAQNFMTLARSGLNAQPVAYLGGIKAALAFLSEWRLPSFEEALFISDGELDEAGVGRGIAYVWEDETHRGHYNIGAIVMDGEDEQCISTRRPMLPTLSVGGDRPVNTIVYFLTNQGFTLPISDWKLDFVDRNLPCQVLPPFFSEATSHDGLSATADTSAGEGA